MARPKVKHEVKLCAFDTRYAVLKNPASFIKKA